MVGVCWVTQMVFVLPHRDCVGDSRGVGDTGSVVDMLCERLRLC